MIYNQNPLLDLEEEHLSNHESVEVILHKKFSTTKLSDIKSELMTSNSLKKMRYEIFSICPLLDVDYGLACYAWVYFEFLIKKGIVNTKNESLILSICFLLALKFYDIDDAKYVNI